MDVVGGTEAGSHKSGANGAGDHVAGQKLQQLTPEMLEKLMVLRTKAHEVFGRIVVTLMTVPRYKHLSLADLQHVVLEPLLHDRIMFAQPKTADGKPDENAAFGIAIWAGVSEEVDAKIQEQIKSGVFPIRLQPKDWISGKINWLLDVIAPNVELSVGSIASFQHAKQGKVVRIHPMLANIVPPKALEQLGLVCLTGNSSPTKTAGAQ